jgi:hypothetical protein
MRARLLAIVQRVKGWYQGRFVEPHNEPNSPVVFLMGHYEQPPLARLLGVLGRFWLAQWKWIIATAIAVIGLIIARS